MVLIYTEPYLLIYQSLESVWFAHPTITAKSTDSLVLSTRVILTYMSSNILNELKPDADALEGV